MVQWTAVLLHQCKAERWQARVYLRAPTQYQATKTERTGGTKKKRRTQKSNTRKGRRRLPKRPHPRSRSQRKHQASQQGLTATVAEGLSFAADVDGSVRCRDRARAADEMRLELKEKVQKSMGVQADRAVCSVVARPEHASDDLRALVLVDCKVEESTRKCDGERRAERAAGGRR